MRFRDILQNKLIITGHYKCQNYERQGKPEDYHKLEVTKEKQQLNIMQNI